MSKNKITIPISQCSNLKTAETKALIDSGAKGKFIDGTIVNWRNVTRLKKPITVRNVDGTHNEMRKCNGCNPLWRYPGVSRLV